MPLFRRAKQKEQNVTMSYLPAVIVPAPAPLAAISEQAESFTQATKLAAYQQGLRDETLRRQVHDLAAFSLFLVSVGSQPADFFHDLTAWRGIRAGLLEAFIEWQKLQGYAIGTINCRLATVKAYCHQAYDAGYLDTDTHTHIQGVKGIPRHQARNIDARRPVTRKGEKKAEPVAIPPEAVQALKHPETGYLARRDALMMCLMLDHGLRVGELAILKRNQVVLSSRQLTFYRPKVDLWQTDKLTKDTYAAALAYLPTLPADQESLFNMAVITIQKRVAQLGKLVGIPGLSPHDCRHSWASRAAQSGTPLDRLKQAGGWSNLQTPLRYIRAAEIANEGVILE